MKTDKRKQQSQRRIIQQKLDRFAALNEPIPPSGWLKAVRGSLGLSIRQLAERVGVGHGAIHQLEKREASKRITLESLDRAARAMDCKVIYAIVPQESGASLNDIIRQQALRAASKIVNDVAHSMRLEAQGTSDKHIKDEIHRIARELIESSDPRIWSYEVKTKDEKE